MEINNITKAERPRERLIEKGGSALSDTELLAIMLGSGTKEENVLSFSSGLIKNYGLAKLLTMSYIELSKIKGIKEGKATRLMACFEIAKRASIIKLDACSFKNSSDIFNYVLPEYKYINKEGVVIIYVNAKLKLIDTYKFFDDSSFEVEIPVKKIIKKALALDPYGIIITHNHPSNDVKPSKADIEVTKKIEELLEVLGIALLDHIVIGKDKYYSMLENGIII